MCYAPIGETATFHVLAVSKIQEVAVEKIGPIRFDRRYLFDIGMPVVRQQHFSGGYSRLIYVNHALRYFQVLKITRGIRISTYFLNQYAKSFYLRFTCAG